MLPIRWSWLVLDSESQSSEYRDGAVLAALEITGSEALARGELVSRAQDCLRRVTALVPDQVISCGGAESMRRKECLRPQPVVFLYCAQHVISGHAIPHYRHLGSP